MSKVAVIGLGYGDEGKGVVTQHLCSCYHNPLVVRFSGGHQCGHTVHHKGLTHTFANFGSGTLLGCPTYWSSYCTFDPVGFWNEFNILRDKGISPIIYINPACPVTTPYDVYANQHSEEETEHGTCGVGFWKTLDRHNNKGVKLSFQSLFEPDFGKKFGAVRSYYSFGKKTPIGFFLECIEGIKEQIYKSVFIETNVPDYENIIFEGSQGILLDQHHGFFPNVTPSNTTPENIIEMGYDLDSIFMVTRSYLTRHGNGPMRSTPHTLDMVDGVVESNVDNEYQGFFRRAILDSHLLRYARNKGISPFLTKDTVLSLVVTCVDHLRSFSLAEGTKVKLFENKTEFLAHLYHLLGVDFIYSNDSCSSETIMLA